MKPYLVLVLLFFGCKPNESVPAPILSANRAYIVSSGSRNVSVIDLDSLKVTTTFTLVTDNSHFPHHIGLSPNGEKLVLANPSYDFSNGHDGLHGVEIPGEVLVLDSRTGEQLNRINVPQANHNAEFSPDGSEIWTAGMSHSGKAYVYDANSGNLKKEIILEADPSELVFSVNGKYALVRSGETTFLYVVEVSTKEIIKQIKVDLSAGNVWPGFGSTVLVSNNTRKSVNFVNLESFRVTDYIDFDFSPEFLIYNETYEELWVCNSEDNQVHVFSKTTGSWNEVNTISFPEADPHMLKFYDEGKKALLVNQKENTAVFLNAETKTVLSSISVGAGPNGIVIY